MIWQVRDSAEPASNLPGDVYAPNPSIAEAFITTDEVNLRSGPGLGHDVLAVMPLHAEVSVTGPAMSGFLPVEVNGTSAWISSDYVVPEGSVLARSSGDVPVLSAPEPEPAVSAPEPEPAVPVSDPEPQAEVVPTEAPVVEEPPMVVAAQTFVEPVMDEPVVEEPGERWIEVDRATATVTLHEGDRVVARYDALIGKDPSVDGYYATAIGTFYVHVKERQLVETPFAPGVYLTDFVGFDPARSNGFHSPTRDEDGNVVNTGGTATLGCVRLGEDEARFLYDFAFIGMRVEVHD